VGDFSGEGRKEWEERVRQNKADERYNEQVRRYNEDVVRPRNEFVERNPELAKEQGIEKLDRREEIDYDWREHKVAEHTASLYRTTRFKSYDEAKKMLEGGPSARELMEQWEKRDSDARKRAQEEWDQEHPRAAAKRKTKEEKEMEKFEKFRKKYDASRKEEMEKERLMKEEIQARREREELEAIKKKEREEREARKKKEREELEARERKRRKEQEALEKKRREEHEKWKLEHPDEWAEMQRKRLAEIEEYERLVEAQEELKKKETRKRKLWNRIGILFSTVCCGAWFASLDGAVASPSDYGGYWRIFWVHDLGMGALFLIFFLLGRQKVGNCIVGVIVGLFAGVILVPLFGVLCWLISLTASVIVGALLGLFVGSVIASEPSEKSEEDS